MVNSQAAFSFLNLLSKKGQKVPAQKRIIYLTVYAATIIVVLFVIAKLFLK